MSRFTISIDRTSAVRTLGEAEIQAFHRFKLSPGNWAALAAAPLFHRPGLRGPNFEDQNDCLYIETLRRELRTVSGLGEQSIAFWTRLAQPDGKALADHASRLLAWHLATDRPFAKRERVFNLLAAAAREMKTGALPSAVDDLIEDTRLAVDCFLPCSAFPADPILPWKFVPRPADDELDQLAGETAADRPWPPIPVEDVARLFPELVRLLGEPAEWWGKASLGRRAVEGGVAVLSFVERERIYSAIETEWETAVPDESAERPADRIREWVEAVRKSARRFDSMSGPAGARPAVGPARTCLRCGTAIAAGQSSCSNCRDESAAAVELRSPETGKSLRLGDRMRVGRSEYREVFGLPDAGYAAADQFELVRDEARPAWRVCPVGDAGRPTFYQGQEIGPTGCELAADGVITVAGRLPLVVRLSGIDS